MLPALIYYLIKKIRHSDTTIKIGKLPSNTFLKIAILFFLLLLLSVLAFSQEKKLTYTIKRKGDVVGNLVLTQKNMGIRRTLKLSSEIKTRFIFLFTAKAEEEAIYDNGILVWSSIYRKLNGTDKANKKLIADNRQYKIYNASKTEQVPEYPILHNMLTLLTQEPLNYSTVYSDNFQQFLEIKKIEPLHYSVGFPDGNYNEYYYDNGLCRLIKIHHSLYTATIELVSVN